MGITIRRAKPCDCNEIAKLLEQIAALHNEGRPDIFKNDSKKYTPEEFENILSDGNRPVFVAADENDKAIGHMFCEVVFYRGRSVIKDYNTLYIHDLCIDEKYRGQHVGKQLFEAVKAYAEAIGVYNIELNVWEFNESAKRFYESCGMKTQRRHMELIL